MIELTERDIKAVARFRFIGKYQWWMLGFLAVLLITMLIVGAYVDKTWLTFLIPMLFFVGGFSWFWRQQDKWERSLVNEWKKSSSVD